MRHTPYRVRNTGYADAPPFGYVNDETTHLTAAGQHILGRNYFAAYQSLASG